MGNSGSPAVFRRFKLVVAYCGEDYDGWQSQPSGNAIQDHLLRAARAIHPDITTVQGSGRTDAGVHALAQVAHFDAPGTLRMDGTAWRSALNTKLPPAIRIMACEEAPPDFHARFGATGKTYRYEIFNGPVLPPWRARRSWHLPKPLDLKRFREAAALFEGRHDFAAFAANRGDPQPSDTVRTIMSVGVQEDGPEIHLTITGEGFLYKMVRLITGSIVRCAQGGLDPEAIHGLLTAPEPGRKAPLAAPADGLYLVEVNYL